MRHSNLMKTLIAIFFMAIMALATNAKPYYQSFSNYDDKVTIVFTDDKAGNQYTVSDVKLIPTWRRQEYQATSVKATVNNGVATATLIFPHITQFYNPKVTLRINEKKTKFKVCQ